MALEGGYCECGCGALAPLARSSDAGAGYVKGQPKRFIKFHGQRGPRHKGPRWLEQDCGYETPCWVWQLKPNAMGYGMHSLSDGTSRAVLAHRYVYKLYKGPIPAGLELDHLCRNRMCVNPDHLDPVTHAENLRRGKNTKLTADDAAAIRESPERSGILAKRYGISTRHVCHIREGRVWREAA